MTETLNPLNNFNDENFHATQLASLQVCEENSTLSADEVPKWLNENFIENILEKHEKVRSLQVNQCGGKGESYVSTMYRVGVSYHDEARPEVEKSRSLILKTLASGGIAADAFGAGNYDVQNKEMEMYQRVLPELKRTLESVHEDGSFYPTVLAVDRALDVIVMEDLMEKKYVMADRLIGQDMNHVKMTLSKIARMHAASVVVRKNDPTAYDKFDMGLFSRKCNFLHGFYESMLDTLIEEVPNWDGYQYYAKKLKNVRKTLIENGIKVYECNEGDFLVLNHGDMWTNNMLFCYNDDGTPKGSILIDFQLPVVASPAVDLLYFLHTSTTDDLRENHIEELLQYYYYELKSVLKKLDHDMNSVPTLQAFQMDIAKRFFYALTSGLLIFPVMIGTDKDANIGILMSTDEKAMNFKRKLMKDPRLQKNVKMMLPRLDAKGILDEM